MRNIANDSKWQDREVQMLWSLIWSIWSKYMLESPASWSSQFTYIFKWHDDHRRWLEPSLAKHCNYFHGGSKTSKKIPNHLENQISFALTTDKTLGEKQASMIPIFFCFVLVVFRLIQEFVKLIFCFILES